MKESIEIMVDVYWIVRLRITFLTAKTILGKFLAYVRLKINPNTLSNQRLTRNQALDFLVSLSQPRAPTNT